MTGIEPAAISGAVNVASKAIEKINEAADEEAKEAEALLRIAEKSGQLDPAALVRAKRTLVKQHIRLKLLQPLGMTFGVPRDYFNTQFGNDLTERLADVPQEEIVCPPNSVAGPAMLGLGFSIDEPDLKAMYLNLIAAASDKRTQTSAHPAFSEVIKQLNSHEAQSLASVLTSSSLPIVEIRRTTGTAGGTSTPGGASPPPELQSFNILHRHVLDWRHDGEQVVNPNGAVFVDNWIRLGLIDVDYSSSLTDEAWYEWVQTTPLMVEAQESHNADEGRAVIFHKGILRPTEFGRRFEQVVISSPQKALAGGEVAEHADAPEPPR